MPSEAIIGPELYEAVPDCGTEEDVPFSLLLAPAVRKTGRGFVKAVYWAGYAASEKKGKRGDVPGDLAAACLEMAAWNMARYKGRRIGLAGNVRGSGRDGEHFELSMPSNVRQLLEPYRRKTI
jgi:hypothetical protein